MGGSWSTEFGPLTLTQTGTKVEGSYTHDSGHVVGTVSGNVFTGRWDEAPTRSAPSDAGAVIFTLQAGGKSFTGRWSYDGDPATFFTTWNGKCTAGSCLQNGVAAVATTFLHLQVIGSDAVVNPSPAGTIYNADCPNNVCIFRYPVGTTVTLTPVAGPFAGWLQLSLELAHPVRGQVALHDHDGWRESRQGRLLTAADEPRLEPRRSHRGLRAGLRHSLRLRPVSGPP